MTASVRLPRPSTRPHRGRADRRDRRRPHERTDTRLARRNGHRSRLLTTTAGDLELRIPKLRAGSFFPSLLERRRRVDQALFAVVMEAYLHGVSTRKVDDLVRALGADSGISKSVPRSPLGTPPMRENRAVARRRRCFLAQVRP
jgi:hypothetical protein